MGAAAASMLALLCADAAAAADGLAYDPTDGSEFFKNVAGAAYVALVSFFAYRVLTRRAKKARTEVRRRAAAGGRPGRPTGTCQLPRPAQLLTRPLAAARAEASRGPGKGRSSSSRGGTETRTRRACARRPGAGLPRSSGPSRAP
jgi:hypothetical protein